MIAAALAAAAGDLSALRYLANEAYNRALTTDAIAAPLVLVEAITFAQLAAAHGERQDKLNHIYLLSRLSNRMLLQGHTELATQLEGQALAFSEAMAKDGDDEIADMIAGAGDKLPAAVFAVARDYLHQAEGL